MKRYALLFFIGVLAAIVLSLIPRLPHRATRPAVAPERAAPISMTVDVYPDRVTTMPSTIPVGRKVALTVVNHTPKAVHLKLAGYEDVVDSNEIDPDSNWTLTFDADRPGEQFAWIVDGEPRGRLDILGSHLIEGHR